MSPRVGTTVSPDALRKMRELGGRFAAYQNIDLSSSGLGHMEFLKFGGNCTFKSPPEKMPDTRYGLGWRYWLVGEVNIENGTIVEVSDDQT
jgi:hypothetical protein